MIWIIAFLLVSIAITVVGFATLTKLVEKLERELESEGENGCSG